MLTFTCFPKIIYYCCPQLKADTNDEYTSDMLFLYSIVTNKKTEFYCEGNKLSVHAIHKTKVYCWFTNKSEFLPYIRLLQTKTRAMTANKRNYKVAKRFCSFSFQQRLTRDNSLERRSHVVASLHFL